MCESISNPTQNSWMCTWCTENLLLLLGLQVPVLQPPASAGKPLTEKLLGRFSAFPQSKLFSKHPCKCRAVEDAGGGFALPLTSALQRRKDPQACLLHVWILTKLSARSQNKTSQAQSIPVMLPPWSYVPLGCACSLQEVKPVSLQPGLQAAPQLIGAEEVCFAQ